MFFSTGICIAKGQREPPKRFACGHSIQLGLRPRPPLPFNTIDHHPQHPPSPNGYGVQLFVSNQLVREPEN